MAHAAPAPIVEAENAFALTLYRQLSQQPGNLIVSPYSIGISMSMLFAGASGETAAQLADALQLGPLGPASVDALRGKYLAAIRQQTVIVATESDALKFHTADALWAAARYGIEPSYIATLRQTFAAAVETVDFAAPQAAADRINQWVARQTEGKIPGIVAAGMLSSDTALILTNAVYFKAAWLDAFDPNNTTRKAFHLSGSRTVPAEMMTMKDVFSLAQVANAKVLALPYRYGEAEMDVILPDDPTGLPGIEAALTPDKLAIWIAAIKDVSAIVELPKFEVTTQLDLAPALSRLGAPAAFTPVADFSGIARPSDRPLHVDDVIHQATITVDEKGTEAAADTMPLVSLASGVWPPAPPVPFIADHPFLYVIRALPGGTILFMGRVDDPTAH